MLYDDNDIDRLEKFIDELKKGCKCDNEKIINIDEKMNAVLLLGEMINLKDELIRAYHINHYKEAMLIEMQIKSEFYKKVMEL